MNTEYINYIVTGVGAIVSLILFITSLIVRFGKGKTKDIAEKVHDVMLDVSQLLTLIAEAEQKQGFTGAAKQEYVVAHYLNNASQVDDTQLRAAIDNLVAFSKMVNTSQKGVNKDNDPRGTKRTCPIVGAGQGSTNGSCDGE